MANVLIDESTMTDIGNAIRNKTGKTDLMYPSEMAGEISNITTGSVSAIENGFTVNFHDTDGNLRETHSAICGIEITAPYSTASFAWKYSNTDSFVTFPITSETPNSVYNVYNPITLDSPFIWSTADEYLGRINERSFYKSNSASAIGGWFDLRNNVYSGPVLIATTVDAATYYVDASIITPSYSFTYDKTGQVYYYNEGYHYMDTTNKEYGRTNAVINDIPEIMDAISGGRQWYEAILDYVFGELAT